MSSGTGGRIVRGAGESTLAMPVRFVFYLRPQKRLRVLSVLRGPKTRALLMVVAWCASSWNLACQCGCACCIASSCGAVVNEFERLLSLYQHMCVGDVPLVRYRAGATLSRVNDAEACSCGVCFRWHKYSAATMKRVACCAGCVHSRAASWNRQSRPFVGLLDARCGAAPHVGARVLLFLSGAWPESGVQMWGLLLGIEFVSQSVSPNSWGTAFWLWFRAPETGFFSGPRLRSTF